jgi:hypothetical protein
MNQSSWREKPLRLLPIKTTQFWRLVWKRKNGKTLFSFVFYDPYEYARVPNQSSDS